MCKWGTDKEVTLCKPRSNGMTTAKVDSCIATLIQALNDVGVETLGCCCGHGKYPGAVMIHHRHIDIEPIVVEGMEMPRVKIILGNNNV